MSRGERPGPGTFEVRRLGPADVAIWTELRLEALRDFPGNFLTTLAEERARSDDDRARMLASRCVLAVFSQGRPAGKLALDPETAAAEAHRAMLNAVYVRSAYQGQGAAQALLDHTFAEAARQGFVQLELRMAARNDRARAFYVRNGFEVWGRLPRATLENGAYFDDIFMARPLGPAA